jgi:hypothetical protein
MQDIVTRALSLKRPSLLVEAAQSVGSDYPHGRLLRRLVGTEISTRPVRALVCLLDQEAELEARRRTGDAGYSPRKHIEVLVVIIGEARGLYASRQIT